MISIEDVLTIHDALIEKFGGSPGLRDKELLESSVFRPFNTFDSKDLYTSPIDKSAALIESIVKNHPFVDGNKRTGYTLMRLFLLHEGLDIEATENEKYDFVLMIAEGKSNYEEIRDWIKRKTKKI
jgi:death on curing protein